MPRFRNRKFKSRRTRRKKMPIVKLIKKVIKNEAEHKYHILSDITSSVVEANPLILDVTNIGAGTDVNSRIGVSVNFSRVKIRFTLRSDANTNFFLARVYLVQSFESIDPVALPNVEELFPPLTQSLTSYKILYDRTFQFGLGINQIISREISFGRGLHEGKWSTTSGQSQVKGNIVFHVVTDNTVADALNTAMESRVYYTDQ